MLIVPALHALKEKYPEAGITLAVDTSVVALANAVGGINDVIVWENRVHSFREIFAFSREIRRRGFDLAIIFNPKQESNLACFLAKIPMRVGYDRKWGFLLTHKIKDEKHLALKHEVEYNLDLVASVGAFTNDKSLKLGIADTGFLAAGKGSYLVAIHPWASDPVKQWPVERSMELAQRITQELKAKVVLVGRDDRGESPQEAGHPPIRPEWAHLANVHAKVRYGGVPNPTGTTPLDMNGEVIDLVNKTSLVELAGVLKQCKVLVTCDSGPAHLAAAVGTPVVALFRNDLPGKTARRWGPWGEGHTVIEKSKLEDISVDEVLKVVTLALPIG